MDDVKTLIRDSIRAARELNHLALTERKHLRACEARMNAGEDCCEEYNARGDALWQIDAARGDCIAFARGMRRMLTYLKSWEAITMTRNAEAPTWTA